MTAAATLLRPDGLPTPGLRFNRYCELHLRHLKGEYAGNPFKLDPWQRDEIAMPLLNTLDRRGFRQYNEALIGVGRGNGKSPLAAALGLYGATADGHYDRDGQWQLEMGAECYAFAGSKEQANIIFGTASAMVRASPLLDSLCTVYRDVIEVPETGSIFRVRSADAGLAHGLIPHICTFDEVHVHKNPDLYEAIQSALHKRRQPLLIGLTTAGWDRETLCYRLYQRGISGDDPRFFFRWWAAPDGCKLTDTKAMRAANPGSWVTIRSLQDQRKKLHPLTFRRLHLNQWTSSEDTWIDMDLWDECGGAPSIPIDSDVYVGVDAAPKKDTTAVVVVRRDEHGVHHWMVKIFKADRMMGYLDFLEVEDYLRALGATFNVRRILVDPFTMMRSLVTLSEEGLPVEEYPQNDARMVPASQTLYDLVLERRLRTGGDPDVRAQAAAAAARETSRGWRLHKLKSSMPIDSIVAGAMASHIAEQEAALSGETAVFDFSDEDLSEFDLGFDDEDPDDEAG